MPKDKKLAEPQNAKIDLWKPRHKVLAEKCLSCPFSFGNHDAFGAVVTRLKRKMGKTRPASDADITTARMRVRMDIDEHGPEFACHNSVYDENMNLRPGKEHRQCPGAIDYAKASKP